MLCFFELHLYINVIIILQHLLDVVKWNRTQLKYLKYRDCNIQTVDVSTLVDGDNEGAVSVTGG